jgi:hypothetical protein
MISFTVFCYDFAIYFIILLRISRIRACITVLTLPGKFSIPFAVSFRGRSDLRVLESCGQASSEVMTMLSATVSIAPRLAFQTAVSTTLTKIVKIILSLCMWLILLPKQLFQIRVFMSPKCIVTFVQGNNERPSQ